MLIQEDFYIDDLHYVLKLNHHNLSFHLLNPPRTRLNINYRKHPELALFRDDPIYEDLNVRLPALKIFREVCRRIEKLLYKHNIHYWTFSATSFKKANVYEKLLTQWMLHSERPFRFDRNGLDFYVYLQQDFV